MNSINESPFVDLGSAITPYELAKIIGLAPLVLLRSVGTVIIWLISTVVLYSPLDRRRWLEFMMSVWVRTVLGFQVTTLGLANRTRAEKVNAVMVYNHVTFMDQFVICLHGLVSFTTIPQYAQIPIVGRFFRFTEAILFTPKSGATNMIVARALDKKKRFSVCIAPEGALSNGKALMKFKTGAFVAKVPILPILLRYPYRHFNPAWTIENPLVTLYRMLCQFRIQAVIEYLPVVHPCADETPREFADRVRDTMARALQVPKVELDVLDKIEFSKRWGLSLWRDRLVARSLAH